MSLGQKKHGSNCEIEWSIRSSRDLSYDSLCLTPFLLIYYMNVFQIQDRVSCWLYHALILRHAKISSMSACDHQSIIPIGSLFHPPFIAQQTHLPSLRWCLLFFFEAQNWSNYSDVTGVLGPQKVAKKGKSPYFRKIQVGETSRDFV